MFFILKNVFCCSYLPYIKHLRSFLEDFHVLAAKVSRKVFSISVHSAHPSVVQFHLKGEVVDLSAFKITFVYRHILTGIRNLDLGSDTFAGRRQLGTVVLVLLESPDKTNGRTCTNQQMTFLWKRKHSYAVTERRLWPPLSCQNDLIRLNRVSTG